MLTWDEIKQAVDSMRFPPDLKVELRQEMHFGAAGVPVRNVLWIGKECVDPVNGGTTLVGQTHHLTAHCINHLVDEVHRALMQFLIHELDEWFTIGGMYYKNPHPEATQNPLFTADKYYDYIELEEIGAGR